MLAATLATSRFVLVRRVVGTAHAWLCVCVCVWLCVCVSVCLCGFVWLCMAVCAPDNPVLAAEAFSCASMLGVDLERQLIKKARVVLRDLTKQRKLASVVASAVASKTARSSVVPAPPAVSPTTGQPLPMSLAVCHGSKYHGSAPRGAAGVDMRQFPYNVRFRHEDFASAAPHDGGPYGIVFWCVELWLCVWRCVGCVQVAHVVSQLECHQMGSPEQRRCWATSILSQTVQRTCSWGPAGAWIAVCVDVCVAVCQPVLWASNDGMVLGMPGAGATALEVLSKESQALDTCDRCHVCHVEAEA